MSDSDSDSDSSSSSDEQTPAQVVVPAATADSDSDSSDSSDDEAPPKATPAPTPAAATTGDDSSSDSDSSDDEDEAAPGTAATTQQDADDSDSDSSSDEEEEAKPATPAAAPAADDDDSDSDSSSDEEEAKPAAAAPVATTTADDDSDSDSSSDEEEAAKPAAATPAKEADSDSDSDSSSDEEEEVKPAAKAGEEKKEESDDDSSEDEAGEDAKPAEPAFVPVQVSGVGVLQWNLKASLATKGKKRKLETSSSTPAAKKSKSETPKAAASSGDATPTKDYNPDDFRSSHLKGETNTLIVKGISMNAYETDVKEFFLDIATPTRVKHIYREDSAGLAFITMPTPELCSKAVIDKNGEYIKDRWVSTDWAEERPQNNKRNSGPRNAHLKGTTVRVWVGNLHREVEKETLKELFAEKGATTDVFIIGNDPTRPKIAYVSFETNDVADAVVEHFQNHSLMDYNLRLDWAEPRKDGGGSFKRKALSEKPEGCVTCFLGRLSDDVDDDKLVEHFKEAGTIANIRYIEKDGEFRGVAFVEFESTEMTDKAVELNGSEFLGRNIRVDYAGERKQKPRY